MSRHSNPGFPSRPFGLLLVEGGDERTVCQAIVDGACWGGLVCWRASGRADLVNLARLAKAAPNFASARSVGVLLDAEENLADALALAADVLAVFGATSPPVHGALVGSPLLLGAFIAPDGLALGAIESLCKRAASRPAVASCVDALVACSGPPHSLQAQADKGWLNAYLAMMPDPTLRFHQAFSPANGLDPDHPAFDQLRDFLRRL